MNKKIFAVLLVLPIFLILPRSAYACDSCQGHNPGDTWSSNGKNYRCQSCTNVACSSGGVASNRCEVANSGGVCDNSCAYNTPDKFTVETGTVVVNTPSCTGVTASQQYFYTDTGGYTVTVSGVQYSSSVYVYIWSLLNNKDDMLTLSATNIGGNNWRVSDDVGNHPTSQGNNTIVVDAYINGPAGGGGVFCGSVIGSLHKATPPTGYISYTWDGSGSLRDSFINMDDRVNIADTPQQINAYINEMNPGSPQSGLSSLMVARRPCNASTSNCALGGGGWVGWSASSYNCPSGAASCSMTTGAWTPIMADLLTSAKWEAVLNGYDNRGYQCSGNVPDGLRSPFDSPYARCDRGVGTADRVTMWLNMVPRAYIGDGYLVNGVSQGTNRNISISAGAVLSIAVYGSDDAADNVYPNNYVQNLRLYRSNPVTPVDLGTLPCPVNAANCSQVFTVNTTAWAPGTYEIYASAIDPIRPCNADTGAYRWSSRNLPFHYRCDRNAGANYSTSTDVITVTVGPPTMTLSGTTFETSTACNVPSTPLGLGSMSGVSAGRTLPSAQSYSGTPGASWSIGNVPQGTNITSFTSTMSPSGSNTYRLTCVTVPSVGSFSTSITNGTIQTTSASYPNGIPVGTDLSGITLGFAVANLPDWGVVYEGDAYNTSGTANIVMPGSVAAGFDNYFLADDNSNNTPASSNPTNGSGYFISSSNLSINRPFEPDGGFAIMNSATNTSLWPTGYINSTPSGCTTINTFDDARANRCNYMTAATFNSLLSAGPDINYTLPAGNSVAVIYVGDSGSTLTIARNIRSSVADRRIMIVSLGNIGVSPLVGYAAFTPSSTPNIGLGIMTLPSNGTPKYIGFPSQGPALEDSSVYINGFLIGSNSVASARDRQANNAYPAIMVRFNPQYLYGLTSAENSSSTTNSTGLFVSNVTWLND